MAGRTRYRDPRRRLAEWTERDPGDRRLTLADLRAGLALRPSTPQDLGGTTTRDAAVLVPLREVDGGLHVVLIERAHDIGSHRGDIAYPGGRIEPGESPERAAVRETEEEIGVPRESVDVVAPLAPISTSTSFAIRPFVGVLDAAPPAEHRSREVERVIDVPFDHLTADGVWSLRRWPDENGPNLLTVFDVPGGGVAWGATGELLADVLEICIAGRLGSPAEVMGP